MDVRGGTGTMGLPAAAGAVGHLFQKGGAAMIFFYPVNGLGALGLLLGVVLGVAVAWIANLMGLARETLSVFATGEATFALAAAVFGFTVDRSEKRGLLASYGSLLKSEWRTPYRPIDPAMFHPERALAIFMFPLVLIPWVVGIGCLVGSFWAGFADTYVRLLGALNLGAGALSFGYGLLTRGRRYVPPEVAQEIQTQFRQMQDERVRQMRQKAIERAVAEQPPAEERWDAVEPSAAWKQSAEKKIEMAEPVAQVTPYRASSILKAARWPLLVMLGIVVCLVVALAINPTLQGMDAFGILLVAVMLVDLPWLFTVMLRHVLGKRQEPCPSCGRQVVYHKKERGLTVICPECGRTWTSGEQEERWGGGLSR